MKRSNIIDLLICGDLDGVVEEISRVLQRGRGGHASGNGNGGSKELDEEQLQQEIELITPYLWGLSEAMEKVRVLFYWSDIIPGMKAVTASLLGYSECLQSSGEDHISQTQTFIDTEFQLRKKLSHVPGKKDTFIDTTDRVKQQFENGTFSLKFKLVLSDLIGLVECYERMYVSQRSPISANGTPGGYLMVPYEPVFLDTSIYYHELRIVLLLIYQRSFVGLEQQKIILSLLTLQQSPGTLITAIIANHPSQSRPIVDLILNSLHILPFDTLKKVVIEICNRSDYLSRYIRSFLLKKQILPDLIFMITSVYVGDEIDLLSSLISNRSDIKWIKDFIAQSPASFGEIRESLLARLERVNTFSASSATGKRALDEGFTIKAILRLYCALNGLLGLKISQAEMAQCLALMENASFKMFSKNYLCFILVCESLARTVQPKRIVDCINHLARHGACDELMLLVSIYFHTHQLPNVAAIAKGILGFKPSIHTESLNQIGEIITKEIYPESLVTRKASQLPVKEALNNNDQSISITCIYHLLSERLFEKYEIDVGLWIWSQISKAATPIHYLLASCIDQLVKNTIEPTTGNSFYMKRIPEAEVLRAATAGRDSQLVQILIVYFVLRYNDTLMKFKMDHKARTQFGVVLDSSQLSEYSIEFLSKLPIQRSLETILSKKVEYFYILPPFLYLISSQYPQFFNVPLLLQEEDRDLNEASDGLSPILLSDDPLSEQWIANQLKQTTQKPTSTLLLLTYFNQLSINHLTQYIHLLLDHLLPILLAKSSSPPGHTILLDSLVSIFSEIWCKVFSSQQSDLALKTLNIFISASSTPNSFTILDIVSDPLIIFRSHKLVFLSPPLMKMLLHLLYYYMVSSKKNLQNQISVLNNQTKQEEFTTLVLTMESSCIQILLEICIIDRIRPSIFTEEDMESCDLNDIEEIRCLICNFIHQLFIEKPLIIKLTHFQGYHSILLPITVVHIASMHICLEFLPELMGQPTADKQIFSIQLLSYLCEKYPIPKCFKICKLAISRIISILQSTSTLKKEKDQFLAPLLPCIQRMTNIFPLLAEDFINILIEQLPITKNSIQFQSPNQISSIFNQINDQSLFTPVEKEIHQTIQIIIKNISK